MDSKLNYIECEVYKNRKINCNIYEIQFKGKFYGTPGQFYMLRAWNMYPLLSRPISISDLHEDGITFLYQVIGKGTEKMALMSPGDKVKLMGPLGNGFSIENLKGRVAVVTGGIGIAPMFYVAKSAKNVKIDLYAGFRETPYMIDRFEKLVDNIYYSVENENGNKGKKGYVTHIFHSKGYQSVLCCGPTPMMKKVVEMCQEESVPVYVSLENRMACGIGACLVCTCKTKYGNKRTCCDGPVFPGEELVL